MSDPYEVPAGIVELSRTHEELYDFPLFRKPEPGDELIYLGWSLGQDLPVLLARDPEPDEDYGDAAAEVFAKLPDELPLQFTIGDGEVAELREGFHDGLCDYWPELTLEEDWHVSLVQHWLDEQRAHVCIRPSERTLGKRLNLFKKFRSRNGAGTKSRFPQPYCFPVKREILSYLEDHCSAHGRLPVGAHTLPDGSVVEFPQPD